MFVVVFLTIAFWSFISRAFRSGIILFLYIYQVWWSYPSGNLRYDVFNLLPNHVIKGHANDKFGTISPFSPILIHKCFLNFSYNDIKKWYCKVTKWNNYNKMRQKIVIAKSLQIVTEVCYKVYVLLQSMTDCCYKVPPILQSVIDCYCMIVITKWDVRVPCDSICVKLPQPFSCLLLDWIELFDLDNWGNMRGRLIREAMDAER